MIIFVLFWLLVCITSFIYDEQIINFISAKTIDNNNSSTLDLKPYYKKLQLQQNSHLPLEEEMKLLEQLNSFAMGRFLLENKVFNGYWASYIINAQTTDFHHNQLEKWILFVDPGIKANRERFYIFRQQLHKYIESNMKIASIPCGLMDDLLNLNYTNLCNIKIVGIDMDIESIKLAAENAQKRNIKNVSFIKDCVWNMDLENCFDIITSNGLNIYVKNCEKAMQMYKNINRALKKNGILITSFITPSPIFSDHSTWTNYKLEDLKKDYAIFFDIIGMKVANFQTEDHVRLQLEEAGFEIIDVIYDSQNIFPTIVARKI